MVRFHPTVEVALAADLTASVSSWSWTDITSRVHNPATIQINRGRRDRYAAAGPGRCELTLLNGDGRFVPRNPVGAYYGQLARNTPLRVSIRPNTNNLSDAFNRTASSGWGSADSGGAWTTAGGSASDFSVSPSSGGRHLHTAVNTRHTSRLGLSIVRSDQTVSIRMNALSTGGAQSAGLVFRRTTSTDYCRGEIRFNTDGSIVGRILQTSGGVDTVNASVTSSLTHSTSTWYRLRVQTGLSSVRLKVWDASTAEPAGWLIDGSSGFVLGFNTAGTGGPTSIREAGNTNSNATVDFDDYVFIDGPRVQFTGFVDQWPVRWSDASLNQSLAPITATGQLRRINQLQTLRSALFRAHTEDYTSTSTTVVGYWPMEDGSGATSLASGIGGPAIPDIVDMSPGADSDILGSDPLPTLGTGGIWSAGVPSYSASTTWAVRGIMRIPQAPSSGTGLLNWLCDDGTVKRWVLGLTAANVLKLEGYNSAGTEIIGDSGVNFADSGGSSLYGRQVYFEVNASQSGSDIAWEYTAWYDDDSATGDPAGIGRSGTRTSATIGNVVRIFHTSYPGFATTAGHTMGHVAVATSSSYGASVDGATGYRGETTSARFTRLGVEQNVSTMFGDLVLGSGSTTQTMGQQRTTSYAAQLREVEETELGILFDGKQGHIQLLPRSLRYNRAVDLTLDASAGQVGWPIEPTDDDYLLRNDVTVSRVDGSSYRAVDTTSVQQVGVYSDSVTINSELDADVAQHAAWRKNVGLTEELRYPQVVLDLTRNHATLAEDWLDADIGGRIQVVNVPDAELPPDDLDLLIEGYTEVIDSEEWKVFLNTSPARPYNVFTLQGGGNLGRPGAVSTLASSANSSTTSLSVATASGPLWRTGVVNFDIGVGGERMTVTNVSGTSSPQTFTVTRSVNGVVKSHSSGASLRLWKPGVLGL